MAKEYKISIHVLREEDDVLLACQCNFLCLFLSTSSARRTTQLQPGINITNYISIHVLREEDDDEILDNFIADAKFLSTSSARRTTYGCGDFGNSKKFLSTSSARRTTADDGAYENYAKDFYPRPPRGGRLYTIPNVVYCLVISIHVLREEDDPLKNCAFCTK